MKKDVLEKKTRKVFHKIHTAQGRDHKIFDRIRSLLTTDYLEVPKGFFQDKICLDAGCGSNANATSAMLHMGAAKVYALDLDSSIVEVAPLYLRGFEEKYKLDIGNILDMDYPDDFFDFTNCAGVLHHTKDAFLGLKELTRVTKKGGILYVVINGKGGVVREITNFLRQKYGKDRQFKGLIDKLTEKDFRELWEWIALSMDKEGDRLGKKIPSELIKELFNNDLVLTIKDRITAPTYHEYSEKEISNWLRDNGFIKIKRLTRNPKISNIRRFLCPFYYNYNHKFSKLLYGDGHIQLKAVKK